jgi:hypothetical protein
MLQAGSEPAVALRVAADEIERLTAEDAMINGVEGPGRPVNTAWCHRTWAMPSPDTFTIKPIAELLDRYLSGCPVVVDPYARRSRRATVSNDLDPQMPTTFHLDAVVFCDEVFRIGVVADVVLFDPPYSPRQIAEVYKRIGLTCGKVDTQNARSCRLVRDGLSKVLRVGGLSVSCGWNSAGFGASRGFVPIEILMVAHGGVHNDTIVVVERKVDIERALFQETP